LSNPSKIVATRARTLGAAGNTPDPFVFLTLRVVGSDFSTKPKTANPGS